MDEDFEIDTEFEEDKGCENTLPCSECVHYASCSWGQYLEYGYGISPNEVLDLCPHALPLSEIKFVNDEVKKVFNEKRKRTATRWYDPHFDKN